MYQRNGLFSKGVFVNEDANTASNTADSLSPLTGNGQNTVIHFYAVQSYCAMNAGMYNKALPVYKRLKKRLIDLNGSLENKMYQQYVYMMPEIAAVRLGKWEQILKTPAPDSKWTYASVLDDFAKGLAYVHEKNIPSAKKCLRNLQLKMDDSLLAVRLMPMNKPLQSCKIAEGILKGELLYEEGKRSEAIDALKLAVAEEDNLVYSEPNNWLIPARQYLGAYLLKMNKAKEAEKVYREDLVWNRGNGWSLLGLHKCMLAQNKTKEAAKYKAAYKKAFEDADVDPVASVF
jgi:tetratricopeptide (TPR) repeat protein